MRLAPLIACIMPLAASAQGATLTSPSPGYTRPPALNDGWRTASADSMGLDRAPLEALTRILRSWPELGVHAVLIERGGALVYEEYFTANDERWGTSLGRVAFTRDTRHDLRSITKSVVSALAGIAIGDGSIASLDRPVLEFFPEYADLNTAERRRVTLAHVLGMTSGLEWNEDIPYTNPRNDEIRMTRDTAPLRYALAPKFAHAPGAEFTYNGGLTQVMASVLERSTKMPIEDYARRKLFEPLGISDVEWVGDLAGMPSAASGLRLRARDLAKIGSLYLHDGQWNGRQILPRGWAERSTRRHFRFRPSAQNPGGEFGYSYFWWYNCYPTPKGLIEARTAVGNGQQRIYVLPGLDMVVTIYAGRYNDAHASTLGSRILREHVLPAVRTGIGTGCPAA
jgi:CubicO group peptidase (beta-lactamase class C family)